MVSSDVFLSPLGLLAALAAIPIVVLYLVRPEPDDLALPSFRFLAEERRRRTTTPLFERLSRSLLLRLQLLVVLLIAVSLASPYVPVDETETVRETVLVVDTSASMGVHDGETSCFDRAVAAASEAVTTRTSVVVTDGDPRVILRGGVPDDARRTLDDLGVTDAPGDLRSAISQASAVAGEDDVVVYSNVEPGRLLRGNVEAGRDAIDRGGGVAIQAQSEFPERYGDLLLVEPETVRQAPTVHRVADDSLTRGIDFQPPDEYVAGELAAGSHLVELNDGTPLLAADEHGNGRVLYYGYLEDRSSFKYNYRYPVFWKRAVFHLAGRESLTSLNHETGERLTFGGERTVETPDGRATGTSVALSSVGVYAVGDRRVSGGLLSASESAVAAKPLDARDDVPDVRAREERRRVPRPLTGYVALAALGAVVLELGYLKRRGDL
jgi:hypothetical protein